MQQAIKVVAKGSGMPQFFNDEAIMETMIKDLHIERKDAYDYAIVGCVELTTQGNNLGWSDAAMFNLNKTLELTLNHGTCLLTQQKIGLDLGGLDTYKSFAELEKAFRIQVDHFIEEMMKAEVVVEKAHQAYLPTAFLSCVIDDCMEKGLDVTKGGAHYNLSGIQMIQVANLADSLAAIKQLVYDEKEVSGTQLLEALRADFKGYEIFDKYRNDLIMNRTIPPNPLFNNPSIISKNISTNVKISENQNIQHHVEISGNYELDNNNTAFDKAKSKYISTMMPIEEENKSMKKYKCTKTWKGHTNKILSLIELNSESEFIVTGSWDKKIIVWKIADEPVIFKNLETNGIIKCLLEFEKNIILFGNGNNIGLWNLALADNKYSFNFSGHKKEVNCLAKCNHNYFASCSDDQTIIIWDYHGKNKFRTIEAHNGKILCLIKLKNGNLCSGGDDLSIKYWDWERGECVGTIPNAHDKMISCLLEKENEDLLSGSYDTTIKLWKGDVILRNIDSHEDTIAALCQIDNIYIASGSFDKNIKIWNINNLECFQSLSGHNDKISCLIKLKNNNSLVSCSYDGIIKIWEND
jgi:hypothetical protein